MTKKQLLGLLAVILLVGFTALGINNIRHKEHTIKLQDVQLQDRSAELKTLELEYKNLNSKLDVELKDKTTTKERVEQLEKEKADLEAERIRLEGELQAKLQRKEAERIAQAQARLVDTVTNTKPAQAAQAPSTAPQTGIEGIIRAAAAKYGIDPEYALRIARCESGLNPNATNYTYYENGNPAGLFQHITGYYPARAAKYGYSTNVYDAYSNANTTMAMFADGLQHLWECR